MSKQMRLVTWVLLVVNLAAGVAGAALLMPTAITNFVAAGAMGMFLWFDSRR